MAAKRRSKVFRNRYWEEWTTLRPWPGPPENTGYHLGAGVEHLQLSEGHAWKKLGKTNHKIGGPFRVVKHEYWEEGSFPTTLFSNNGSRRYRGGLYAYVDDFSTNSFPPASYSTDVELGVLGARAIGICAPTNPVSNLTQFLGELREGVPRVTGSDFFRGRASVARNAGSEYLNHQFGWLPLVSDVQKFGHAVRNSKEIIDQYIRNSGKRIKRRLDFPQTKSTTITDQGTKTISPSNISTQFFESGAYQGNRTLTTETIRDRWFEGCFTYYLPPPEKGGVDGRHAALANKLYGTRLTPETLWNLAPWTWGVDWFVNIGDLFHNASLFANDGLVMYYGYMMETTTITYTYTLRGIATKNPKMKWDLKQNFRTVTKVRVEASPFGFGLLPSSFTTRQLAILAALGISRSGQQM